MLTKRHLHLVQPGEVGVVRRRELQPCRCGHHLLAHSHATLRGERRFCGCARFQEQPPHLELVR